MEARRHKTYGDESQVRWHAVFYAFGFPFFLSTHKRLKEGRGRFILHGSSLNSFVAHPQNLVRVITYSRPWRWLCLVHCGWANEYHLYMKTSPPIVPVELVEAKTRKNSVMSTHWLGFPFHLQKTTITTHVISFWATFLGILSPCLSGVTALPQTIVSQKWLPDASLSSTATTSSVGLCTRFWEIFFGAVNETNRSRNQWTANHI